MIANDGGKPAHSASAKDGGERQSLIKLLLDSSEQPRCDQRIPPN